MRMMRVRNSTLRLAIDNSVNLRETLKSRLDLAAFLLHNVDARIDRDFLDLVPTPADIGQSA